MACSNASEGWPTSRKLAPTVNLLTGGGATGEEIRRCDWGARASDRSKTGPLSLKTTVRLVPH